MKTDCPRECDAAAWLADELPPGDSAAYERHLSDCAQCRRTVEATRRVLDQLQSLQSARPQRDLAPALTAKLRAQPTVIPFARRQWVRAAAAVAVILLPAAWIAWHLTAGETERPGAVVGSDAAVPPGISDADAGAVHVTRALDWFCIHQEIDGSWDPAKWGGNTRFKPALTALPLISLLKSADSPGHSEAAARAVAWLRREQTGDGAFTRSPGDGGYNHSIATLALLYAWQVRPEPELKASATAALQFALRTQTAGGGWGHAVKPDVSVTLWYTEMLDLAARLGWDEARPALSKARHWLASQPLSGVTAASGESKHPDYLQSYFAVTRLLREDTAEASTHLASIRRQLATSQSLTGEYPGTWEPSGSCGRAGGRIYSTALACLALR